MSLRLMIYDRTDRGRYGLPGLSAAWRTGATLYRALGRFDAWRAVADWEQALDWVAGYRADQPIGEIQFWGHGKWGRVLIDSVPVDAGALEPGHDLHGRLCAIRERLALGAHWWFRTCETFGAQAGHDFARQWADFFGRRVAGHTYVIAGWQSGLHSLEPGMEPAWSASEGIAAGDPSSPRRAKKSRPWEPNTIHLLQGAIPDGY